MVLGNATFSSFVFNGRRLGGGGDDGNYSVQYQTDSMVRTLYTCIAVCILQLVVFEICRHIKPLYLKRVRKSFIAKNRVPPTPGPYFAWIYAVLMCVDDESLLRMIGLDGFMLLRFIYICFKTSCFLTIFGCIVLLPVYATAGGSAEAWDIYTVSNIPDKESGQYWGAVFSAYVVAAFFCRLMHIEYEIYFKNRLDFLVAGDDETPRQTAYTIMVENVPPEIRSSSALAAFIEDIFPDKVFCCILAKDTHVLDKVVRSRLSVVTKLEKADAFFKATGKRPTKLVYSICSAISDTHFLTNEDVCFRSKVDSIEFYRHALGVHNILIKDMQMFFCEDNICIPYLDRVLKEKSRHNLNIVSGNVSISRVSSNQENSVHKTQKDDDLFRKGLRKFIGVGKAPVEGVVHGIKEMTNNLQQVIPKLGRVLHRNDAEKSFQYENSSTAFVTMTTLKCVSVLHKVILSHNKGYDNILVKPAPNPYDILWDNVHVPHFKYEVRHSIADILIYLGVVFWAAIVAVITTISNLDNLANNWTWLSENKNETWYQVLNDYVPFLLILALMAVLPLIFDFIARYYERLKCESEIQKSIMNRYFYFQLANVYVAIAAGSVSYGIDEIITKPYNIINILGDTLPGVSLYFASLLIVWTFVQLPFELIGWRLFYFGPWIMGLCNKKMMTCRDWRMGVGSDFPILYGWIYPNQVFVMMVMMAYSCITPLLMPFCLVFYGFSYIIYKYQLLFVWVNRYQSGGDLWYEVFGKSMISLIGGVVTLLSYLALKQTVLSGPFYFLLPLPFMITYFWRRCERKYKKHSQSLSIHRSVQLDRISGVPKCNESFRHSQFVNQVGLTGDTSFFTIDSIDSFDSSSMMNDVESHSNVDSISERERSKLIFFPDLYRQRCLFVDKMEPDDNRQEVIVPVEEPVKTCLPTRETIEIDNLLIENDLGENLIKNSDHIGESVFGIDGKHNNGVRDVRDLKHFEKVVDEILHRYG